MQTSRRNFLLTSAAAALGCTLPARGENAEPIIDIHQHTNYAGRANEDFLEHQHRMGVTLTVLLPAGSVVMRPSTHNGKSNGLAARAMGNESVQALAREYPKEFVFGANEVTDLPNAREEIERCLKLGAKVIGEQKFGVDCDSPESQELYQLAERYDVPVLLHFQHATYNTGIERFHTMLEKFPKVRFIGHAQTMWANIDAGYTDQTVLYPKGPISAGGLTDRLLTTYKNFYGDLSAGSALNAMTRDEDHARGFIERHQDQLMYGSDCADIEGQGERCSGAQMIAAIRRLGTNEVQRKLFSENAKRVFRL
jgi:predicted TIM-barrel fold metal-dependent hydrolase